MPRIPKTMPGNHDQVVRKIARQLKDDGWSVKADLPGRKKPEPIGRDNRVPDITATKAGAKKLIEVETPSTLSGHQNQISTFRRSASQQSRTSLNVVVANED